ncbi:hypothetical protein [Bradyrhizobium japonicum]|uniref:hypothetical protein n=1 Tax=Bradyrhizobium japonicum TaxID=375 RepID=UPI000B2A08B3|nr:hypothetical protein [Bradyrhizobium japonicum]MCD9113141.1 hypothetical protein [Bradyrhizobium japonicum]MCD9260499.1 hypothetical protein [Bradyrhizobium japonicum SEMIA 5079]MCD9913364.1 hypothetical protein [Bradyrhizobium japonicum]MCS3977561.1 hypothetical protein [Bradyrhizobium japonicum]WRI75715.1 hypothetical protein RZE83_21975 [Bradyrhizobium japonicum]
MEWRATAPRGALADWLPDNEWNKGIAKVEGHAGRAQGKDGSFDLRWRADMRAIKHRQ